MPRRYRLTWEPDPMPEVPQETPTHGEFARDNADAPDIVLDSLKLTLGQSIRIGGGAAPVVTITCIEE